MAKNIEIKILNNEKKMFCTECGDELDEFALSESGGDLEAALIRYRHCKEIGKFNGELCARVFIAENNLEDFFPDDENEEDSSNL